MGKSVLPQSWMIKGVTCILSFILVIPPVIMAQMFPGPGGRGSSMRLDRQLDGEGRGGNGRVPGEPILVDPNARNRITPSFAPCPAQISDVERRWQEWELEQQELERQARWLEGREFTQPESQENHRLRQIRNLRIPPIPGSRVPLADGFDKAEIVKGLGPEPFEKLTPEESFFQSLVPRSDGKPLEQFGYDFFPNTLSQGAFHYGCPSWARLCSWASRYPYSQYLECARSTLESIIYHTSET